MSAPPDYPQSIGEIMDRLAWMMLYAPELKDDSGFFPERNIETNFEELALGLRHIRSKLGEPRYEALTSLSERMRKHFEANTDEDTLAGRELIHEMEDILRGRRS
jgi:hypothetical protein